MKDFHQGGRQRARERVLTEGEGHEAAGLVLRPVQVTGPTVRPLYKERSLQHSSKIPGSITGIVCSSVGLDTGPVIRRLPG